VAERSVDRRAAGALAGASLLTAAWLLYLTRGATFHYDEWNPLVRRRGHDLDTFFSPHNEHVNAVPVAIFKSLLETVGATHYLPYQLLPIGLHLIIVALVFAVARPALGDRGALVPAVLVLAFGAAWEDILWPFQIGYMIPVATTLAALLLIRGERTARDAAAAAVLVVGMLSSSTSVPLLGGIALVLLIGVGAPAARLRRCALVAGVPAAVYAAWSLRWGTAELELERVPAAIHELAEMLQLNLTGILATPSAYGPVLAALVLAAICAHVLQARPIGHTLVAVGVAALAIWFAQALFRPGFVPSRYLYPGGVMLVLVVGELVAARPGLLAALTRPRTQLLAGVAALIVLSGQVANYQHGGRFFRDWGRFTNSSLAAIAIIGKDTADPLFKPDPVLAPDLTAERFFTLAADYGSPAPTAAELRDLPEDARQNADSVLAAGERIAPKAARRPRPAGPPPTPIDAGEGAKPSGDCVHLTVPVVELRMPPRGIWVHSTQGVTVRLRRFADAVAPEDKPPGAQRFRAYVTGGDRVPLRVPRFDLAAGASTAVATPADGAPEVPWTAVLTITALTEVCGLP